MLNEYTRFYKDPHSTIFLIFWEHTGSSERTGFVLVRSSVLDTTDGFRVEGV
jgi:hypothetical protein